MSISLCSLDLFDSVLYVLEEGQEKWCNDDGESGTCGESAELADLLLIGGKTYHVVVDGYNGAGGMFQLEMREAEPRRVSAFDGRRPQVPRDTYVVRDTFGKAEAASGQQVIGSAGSRGGLDSISSLRSTKGPESADTRAAVVTALSGAVVAMPRPTGSESRPSQDSYSRSDRTNEALSRFFSVLESGERDPSAGGAGERGRMAPQASTAASTAAKASSSSPPLWRLTAARVLGFLALLQLLL